MRLVPDMNTDDLFVKERSKSEKTKIITMFKRYRQMRNNLQKTLLLATSSDKNKIKDYLMIRRCENAPFQD